MSATSQPRRRCALSPSGADPGLEHAYLFAYDISGPKRARLIRRCLQRWRLDGQLSLHEIRLPPWQLQELAVELLELADNKEDKLLVARLSRRGYGPVLTLGAGLGRAPVTGLAVSTPCLPTLADGWHLIAYDITDPRRLQRFQRQAARVAAQLQRSVYLFHGRGAVLQRALAALMDHFHPKTDDLRLYPLAGPDHLWSLCGLLPPLAGMSSGTATAGPTPASRHPSPGWRQES